MITASDNLIQSLLPVFLVAGVCSIVLMFTWRRQRRHRQARPIESDDIRERVRQRSGVRDDMQVLLVELEEYARKMNAQIDTKTAKLEILLQQADKRVEQLRQLINAADPSVVTETVDPRHKKIYDLADQGRSSHQIAQSINRNVGEVELILALRPASGNHPNQTGAASKADAFGGQGIQA